MYTICSCRSDWFWVEDGASSWNNRKSAATWGLLRERFLRVLLSCSSTLLALFIVISRLSCTNPSFQSRVNHSNRLAKISTVSVGNTLGSHLLLHSRHLHGHTHTKEEGGVFSGEKWVPNVCRAAYCAMELGERCNRWGGSCSCWSSFWFLLL